MKKINWRKVKIVTGWSFLTIIFFTSIGFATRSHDKIKCRNINIRIVNAENFFFIEKEDILEMLHKSGYTLYHQNISSINIHVLEKLITSNPFVAKAEVFFTINGDVQIRVVQREPVLRIINKSFESFYIDKEGKYMPLSNKFTAHVIAATGYIDAELNDGYTETITLNPDSMSVAAHLYRVADYLQKDNFWSSQVEQVYVNSERELELTPRVGSHQILIGDSRDLERKFNVMMTFYNKGINRSGWKKYKTINLKYNNQIIGTLDN